MSLADDLLKVLNTFDPSLKLKYNKLYIGLEKDGQPYNFVTFRPKKNQVTFELKLPHSSELDAKIDAAGSDTLEYNKHWGVYRLRLTREDISAKAEVIKELARITFDRRVSM